MPAIVLALLLVLRVAACLQLHRVNERLDRREARGATTARP
jgi:hypothetical protein